jgi:hypothetical protein
MGYSWHSFFKEEWYASSNSWKRIDDYGPARAFKQLILDKGEVSSEIFGLTRWKKLYLSKGGRLTLIKSMQSN